MTYETIKSLHIIFVVTWFAGLFYLVRLFIYHTEAQSKSEEEKKTLSNQFLIMEKRLWYGICIPSSLLALAFGGHLLTSYLPLSAHTWLKAKLHLVVLLFVYHHYCGWYFKQLRKEKFKLSSTKLRVLNEVATVFLVAIVFLVVNKNIQDMLYALAGLALLMALIMGVMKIACKKKQESTHAN